MQSDDVNLRKFLKTSPKHPLVRKAAADYARMIERCRGGIFGRFAGHRSGEPAIVYSTADGETRAIVGLDSWQALEKEWRSTTTGEPVAPSKYLVEHIRAGEKPPADPDRPGAIRTIDSKGDIVMTSQPRIVDFTMSRAFDPASYTVDGRRFGEDWTRSLGRVRVAGLDAPVQLTMFPKKIAGFESGDFHFETKRTPVSEGLLFFGDRTPPTDEQAASAADRVFGMGGHIYKLTALAHSLDGWLDWTHETADRFHWPSMDSKNRGQRNAFEYLEIARAICISHRGVSRYPIPLVESITEPGVGWRIRRPFVLDGAGKKINLQSRPTGALFRNPRNKKDALPLVYAVGESILQSGAGVDTDNKMPVLVDSSDGTGWHDTLLFWGLCGRPVPNTRKERLNARRFINRKLEEVMDSQSGKDETVVFDLKRKPGRANHATFKVVATDLFREAHRRSRKFSVRPVDNFVENDVDK